MLVAVAVWAAWPTAAHARRDEPLSITSTPDGARVYIDGKYVGRTPLALEFPCSNVGDRRYRIERDGCAPAEGILNARVAPGRIVGAAFCFAINLIFQCTMYYQPVVANLECAPGAAAETWREESRADTPVAPKDLPPPPTDIGRAAPPAAATSSDADAKAVKELRDLEQLHTSGALTDKEYKAARERVLRQLGE